MIKYFLNVNNKDEFKAKYKELVKKHHPDRGGDVAIFQEMQAEYEKIIKHNLSFPLSSGQAFVNFAEMFGDMAQTAAEAQKRAKETWENAYKTQEDKDWYYKRQGDILYDVVEEICNIFVEQRKSGIWLISELNAIDDLTFNHFKFVRYILKKKNPSKPLSDSWLTTSYINYVQSKKIKV